MTRWKPKHEKSARMKAAAVANYVKRFRKRYGKDPIYYYIALNFDRSEGWAGIYKRLAKEYGYL